MKVEEAKDRDVWFSSLSTPTVTQREDVHRCIFLVDSNRQTLIISEMLMI